MELKPRNLGLCVCDKVPALVAYAYSLDPSDPRQREIHTKMLDGLERLRDILSRHHGCPV